MSQRYIPAIFARGGTSKGLFFLSTDLPQNSEERDELFLAAMGSPDANGRQLDGMGGGVSSLSKIVILDRSSAAEADVDYTFGQVAVDTAVVDYGANCGNLASAVGPVAVETGLVPATDGMISVRIRATNTNQMITSTFEVRDGKPVVDGDFVLDGVSGCGAPIELEFHEPAGSLTGSLLPSGRVSDVLNVDRLGGVEVSMLDSSNPVVFVESTTVGMHGREMIDDLEADVELIGRLDRIRRAAGVAMGIGSTEAEIGLANPKIAVVSTAEAFTTLDGRHISDGDYDISVRMISMSRWHRAVTSTGALCLATAAAIANSLPWKMNSSVREDGALRIGHPSGVTSVRAATELNDGTWSVYSASLYRTARILMRGEVACAR